MEFFNNWVQGIVVAVIITILIEMILPEGNSKKYIKIMLGIYVVFSIISPVIGKITGGSFEVSSIINMDKYAKELGTYEEMIKERNIEYKNNENVRQIYVKKLEEDIISKLKNKGYKTKKVEVNVKEDESYELKNIKIYIDKDKENKEKEEKEEKEENDGNKKSNQNNEKRINIENKVDEIKIENITVGKKEDNIINEEGNATFFEKNEIKKSISEIYGVEEDKIIVY